MKSKRKCEYIIWRMRRLAAYEYPKLWGIIYMTTFAFSSNIFARKVQGT